MTFEEAQGEVLRLSAEKEAGRISSPQYADEINRLRVLDARGIWWQPDPYGKGWLRWDGSSWVSDTPLASRKETPAPLEASGEAKAPAGKPAIEDVSSRLGKSFMGSGEFVKSSTGVPLSRRPQPWWDTLSVVAGIVCGYLWFVYSSVRGLPRLTFLSFAGSLLDFIPAFLLLCAPVLLFLLWRFAGSHIKPLRTLSGKFSRTGKIVAVSILGAAVLLLQGRNLSGILSVLPFYSLITRIIMFREGLDFVTPFLMIVVPVILVWFRKEIDVILAPLHPLKKWIPRPVLLGMSLAAPILTALILNSMGFREYPLMHLNMIIGTALSYVLIRTPRVSGSGKITAGVLFTIFLCAFWILLYGCGWADDFLRDPFNLNDGLRTPGIAPILAGVPSVVISIIVNGVEVGSVTITGEKLPDGQKADRENYLVVVDSTDKNGAPSTLLDNDEHNLVYILAHCEKVGKGRFPQGDGTIKFSPESGVEWIKVTDIGTRGGRRCASVTLPDVIPEGDPPDKVSVHVSAGVGELIGASVSLTLDLGLKLSAEVVNGEVCKPFDPANPIYFADFKKEEKEWEFKEIKLFFRRGKSMNPVRPSFEPVWEKIQIDPEYLECDPPRSSDGNLTWRVNPRLKAGAQITEEWLVKDGKIKMTVRCSEGMPQA